MTLADDIADGFEYVQDFANADYVHLNLDVKISDIETLAKSKNLQEIAISDPVDPEIWPLLDKEILAKRPGIKFRVYEMLQPEVDLAFLAELPHVTDLSADCIYTSKNAEGIGTLPNLEKLRVGILDLTDIEFLSWVPATLKSLTLERTESKKPDLSVLARFKDLETLYLEGHKKNIDVLSQLTKLHTLTLRSISTPDVGYLAPLKKLRNLEFKLGGIKNFETLRDMQKIEYVEFWQVRDLADLGFLPDMTGLKYLFLQALKQLERLPDLSPLKKLKSVTFWNMKGLHDIDGLAMAPALRELFLIDMGHRMQPEDWLPVLDTGRLKNCHFGFGSDVKNERFAELLAERKIEFPNDHIPH